MCRVKQVSVSFVETERFYRSVYGKRILLAFRSSYEPLTLIELQARTRLEKAILRGTLNKGIALRIIAQHDGTYSLTETTMSGRHGDWMQLVHGEQYWPCDPRPEDYSLEATAHSLSMQCRYVGHCKFFYPVAQHAVLGSYLCPPSFALKFLHHDDPESVTGDMSRPLKRSLNSDHFKEIEDLNEASMFKALGLEPGLPEEVHVADECMLVWEKRDVMNPSVTPWSLGPRTQGFVPPKIKIRSWSPRRAKREYLHRHYELTGHPVPLHWRVLRALYNLIGI